jgi:hypothetical protein
MLATMQTVPFISFGLRNGKNRIWIRMVRPIGFLNPQVHGGVSVMAKDLFARHTPKRFAGCEIRKKATDDISFLLKYKRSECTDLLVTLDFCEYYFSLGSFRLSFCLACGRFLGFGTQYNLCWICESELEQFNDDETL